MEQHANAAESVQPMRISDTFAMKQGLMGFAALWIYLFHVWLPVFGAVPVLGRLEEIVKYVGFAGVDLFFFLSGGGLVFSMQKRTVWGFYRRRLERILIPYLILAVCYALVQHWDLLLFLSRVSGVYFYTKNVYGFLWYIPAILTLYLLFPVYYLVFTRSKNKSLFTLLVLVLWFAASILLRNTLREDLYSFTNRLPIFLLGVLCGQKMLEKDDALPRWFPLAMAGALLVGVALAYVTNVQKIEILFPRSNAAFPTLFLTLGIAFLVPWMEKRVVRRKLTALSRFFGFFGGISLSFYCTQELIFGQYQKLFGLHSPVLDNIVLLIAITALSWALNWLTAKILLLLQKRPHPESIPT